MADETTNTPVVTEQTHDKSVCSAGDTRVFGVSVRGWLAVEIVTATIVAVFVIGSAPEPLSSLCALAVGFYYGQARK
jgi:hypothetical protein